MATDYSSLKAAELKDLLKERGVALTGLTRKQQFIEALEAYDQSGGNAPDENEILDNHAQGHAADTNGNNDNGEGENVKPAAEKLEHEQTSDAVPADGLAIEDGPRSPHAETSSQPAEDAADKLTESRKRKRRSPTPPISQEIIEQKLEHSHSVPDVMLPEDTVIEDALPVSDAEQPISGTTVHGSQDTHQAGDDMLVDVEQQESDADDLETGSSRSLHPTTRAIYIRELVRPLQPAQLREHLELIANSSGAQESSLETFHLDTLRTHAFAVFQSAKAATRVRRALHDTVWPNEPMRKALWVDYVPEEKVSDWIDTETGEGGSRRDARRWEVVYNTNAEGETIVDLAEVSRDGPRDSGRPSQVAAGTGVPSAPLGPRADRRPSPDPNSRRASTDQDVFDDDAPPGKSNKSFNVLDERFHFTTAKPKIYYLPQPREMVERRLRELESQTSRDWKGNKAGNDGPGSQLRRYTFDDGDVLVDSGPDFGNFGVPRPARRGGGFRGRR